MVNDSSTNAIDLTNVTTISTATSLEILEVINNTNATFTTAPDYAVVVSDQISATNTNTIVSDTSGIVTATVNPGTASALNGALVNASEPDALTLTVTGTAAASDLTDLDAKTSVNIGASGVTTITGTQAEVAAINGLDGYAIPENKTRFGYQRPKELIQQS